jgi:predicted RND superfamily exporter protein
MSARELVRTRLTPRWILTRLVAALLLAATAGGLARVHVETGLESFLPAHDASVTQLNRLASTFGGEPVVVLFRSAKPKQLLDPSHLMKLVALEGELSQLPDVAIVYGPGTILNQVAGQAQDLLAELSGRRDAVQAQAEASAKARGASPAAVRAAGRRALDSFDARYGPLLVQGLPAGLPTLHNPKFADSVIFSQLPDPRAQWRFVVPDASSVALLVRPRQGIDAAASTRLVQAIRHDVSAAHLGAAQTTISGVPALVAALSNQVSSDLPWLGSIGLVTVGGCFLLVPWTARRRRLRPLVSTVVAVGMTLAGYGWLGHPLSLGVVAFLPVLLGIGSYYPTYFARQPDRRIVFTVALATAASFATLALSPLPFVRDLGTTLAVGIVCCALVGAAVTPRPEGGVQSKPDVRGDSSRGARWIVVGAVAAAVSLCGWLVLPRLPVQSNFEHYASGLPALHDAERVAATMGSSAELDVVLTGPDALSPAAYRWLVAAQNTVLAGHGDKARPIVSVPMLLSFLGPSPTTEELAAGARLVPAYLLGAAVAADHSTALLSFGVDLSNLPAVRRITADLRRQLPATPHGYQVEIAGLPVVAVRGEQLVSADRLLANVLGILAATIVLACGLRRRTDALRACATAVLANGLGLFVLWAVGVSLTPLTVALGALTGAIACEFSVMLAEAERQRRRVLRTSVALAVTASTAGYLTLLASSLGIIREFGALLAGAVVVAWLCAWCVVALTRAPRPRRPIPVQPKPEKILVGARA